jgi:polar amino acid transport system substrate-binding protein
MRRLILVIALLLLPGLARAQAPVLTDPGQLTWGASVTFPPFEFQENGQPAGFDIDLVSALAKQMGLRSNIMPIAFKGLIPALEGKRIDIIVSGMYINPQRLEVADMVPYLLVGNQIVVLKGNPRSVESLASLCGHNVAAPVATVFEASARQASATCKAAGKPEINVLSLAGTTACALALTQGRADAIIVSTPTVAALMHETPDTYEPAGAPFNADTKVGIAISKDNPGLTAAVTKALQAVVKDGTYAALLKKWGMPAASSAF